MTLKIQNIARANWKTRDGRTATFAASTPVYGIQDTESGLWLTTDGESPSVWSRKAIASEVAPYAAGFKNAQYSVELVERPA